MLGGAWCRGLPRPLCSDWPPVHADTHLAAAAFQTLLGDVVMRLALGLTETSADTLADARTGKNGRHLLVGLLRQSVFGRLAGYEDVNDADRLSRDPAMRWVVGDRAITGSAASASQMGRFETKWLCRPENLAALADLLGRWIDKVHQQRPPRIVVLDMDSSESPTYGEQEGSAYNDDRLGARKIE